MSTKRFFELLNRAISPEDPETDQENDGDSSATDAHPHTTEDDDTTLTDGSSEEHS